MSPYRVLVAEILLKRTTASAVDRIFHNFIKECPKIGDLAQADLNELEGILQTIGYHKQRSQIFKQVSQYIIDNFGGKIPSEFKHFDIIIIKILEKSVF